MTMHRLPFGASISNAMLAMLKTVAAQAREQTPAMIPSIRLVERWDAMVGLKPTSEGRLSFHAEPVNRLTPYSARSAATEWKWGLYSFERKYAHSVFVIDDFQVEIGEEAQAALKGNVLDLVDGKIITIASHDVI
jgi:hypothetical protein